MDEDLEDRAGKDQKRRERPVPQHVAHHQPERDDGEDDRQHEPGQIAAPRAMGLRVAAGLEVGVPDVAGRGAQRITPNR